MDFCGSRVPQVPAKQIQEGNWTYNLESSGSCSGSIDYRIETALVQAY